MTANKFKCISNTGCSLTRGGIIQTAIVHNCNSLSTPLLLSFTLWLIWEILGP